jgi:acyl carrier protein
MSITAANPASHSAKARIMSDIETTVRHFLLEQFLPGEDPAQLTNDTPLVTGGILDSIATLQLVSYLEKTFGIELQAHETSVDHLNTVADIVRLVESKRNAAAQGA